MALYFLPIRSGEGSGGTGTGGLRHRPATLASWCAVRKYGVVPVPDTQRTVRLKTRLSPVECRNLLKHMEIDIWCGRAKFNW